MKKYKIIIWCIIVITLLTSCSTNKFEAMDNIKSPNNNNPPLQGKWTVETYIDSPYNRGNVDRLESLIGKEALFHKDAIVIGEDYILEPTYKLKNVNLSDYLLYKYKMDPEELNLNDVDVQILTISSDNHFFYEFIKYNDSEMITFVDDKFYFLKKNIDNISKEEIDRYINVEKSISRITNIDDIDTIRTGILLGIKTSYFDELTQSDNWQYKTLWLRFNNRQMASSYEMEDLLVPRKKGFWLVDVKRDNGNDKIEAMQKTELNNEMLYDLEVPLTRTFGIESKEIYTSILKNILYIGNDYVSTEVINRADNKKTLEVYPIDYLEDEKTINISDIIGEDGLIAFKEGAQSILKSDNNIYLDETSFGLTRRNGYWIMKGRINYQSNDEELYNDFNIKRIPPKELVNYDELVIPWNKVKSRVPEAIDAFTSPNDDIIIIVTRNELLIYSIVDYEISQKELGKLKMDNSDTIIMAEWCIGRYAMLWEEEVLKSDTVVNVEY